MNRRDQNKIQRRDRIISAATTIFARAGFNDASMDEIAAHAGLSKPTLYQYFDSKSSLFQSIMKVPRDEMLMAFNSASHADWIAQLHDFAWRYAKIVLDPELISLARVTIGEANKFPGLGRTYQESGPDKVRDALIKFMSKNRDMGLLIFDDPELAAEDFWGLILSAPRNRALHDPGFQLSDAQLARFINNGLRVFVKAYSSNPAADIDKLENLIVRKLDL